VNNKNKITNLGHQLAVIIIQILSLILSLICYIYNYKNEIIMGIIIIKYILGNFNYIIILKINT